MFTTYYVSIGIKSVYIGVEMYVYFKWSHDYKLIHQVLEASSIIFRVAKAIENPVQFSLALPPPILPTPSLATLT